LKKYANKLPLYITLGIVIISTVSIVVFINSRYTYIETKNNIIEEMEHSSRQTIISLQKNMAPLMASFSVNEYETLVFNEMQLRPHFAIVVEDFNMGKIVGKKSYISGKIRHEEGTKGRIIDFDVDNSNQTKQLETCCYSEKEEIRSAMGEKLGTVVVYSSNHRMEKELNEIITGTVINAIAISASLILLLLFTIRYFILKPIWTEEPNS